MKRFVLSLLVAFSVGVATMSAQTGSQASAFLGVNIGAFGSNVPGFDSFYASRVAFCYGGTVGVPAAKNLFVFFKFDCFSISRVPISGPNFYDPMLHPSPQIVTVNASAEQWMFKLGVMKALENFDDIGLAVDAGLTFSTFATSLSNPAPGGFGPPPPERNHRALGVFIGLVGQHRFGDSPCAIVVEPQYSQFWTIGTPHIASYGDLIVSGGIRLYLEAM